MTVCAPQACVPLASAAWCFAQCSFPCTPDACMCHLSCVTGGTASASCCTTAAGSTTASDSLGPAVKQDVAVTRLERTIRACNRSRTAAVQASSRSVSNRNTLGLDGGLDHVSEQYTPTDGFGFE